MTPFLIFLLFLISLGWTILLIHRERQSRLASERKLQELSSHLQTFYGQLEEERARLETLFSGMVEGVLLTDHRGDILHSNPAFREMFALKEKTEGRSALEILASVACDDAIQEVIRKGKPVEREIVFEKPRRRVFQVHFSPIHREGELFGVVSVFHDLTEIRRLEEVRRDFIANLSHELKTPLTAIRGYSETLLEESAGLPAESKKHLEIIFRHATNLEHLMENLLNLSRIESGKEELVLEPVRLKDFVDRLLERFAVQARVKHIELCNEIPENAPPLQVDPTKFNQILSNLVDNAIKYSLLEGKVWIRCRRSEEREYQIEVEDKGPGIPAEEQGRIFERFYRLDKARSRDSGGTGLGLAIAKHLVELHGGRIDVISAPRQGSKFRIFLKTQSENKKAGTLGLRP